MRIKAISAIIIHYINYPANKTGIDRDEDQVTTVSLLSTKL
jgi:hypothetical protein